MFIPQMLLSFLIGKSTGCAHLFYSLWDTDILNSALGAGRLFKKEKNGIKWKASAIKQIKVIGLENAQYQKNNTVRILFSLNI